MKVKDAIATTRRKLDALMKLDADSETPYWVSDYVNVSSKEDLGRLTKAYLASNPGADARKRGNEDTIHVDIELDGLIIACLYGSKSSCCKVVEQHEEEYEEEVPDPEAVIPMVKVKKTRTVTTWDCGEPILAAAREANNG